MKHIQQQLLKIQLKQAYSKCKAKLFNATCNGCRLVVVSLKFGALNVVFKTWVFLGFFTDEIWAECKKSCGNTGQVIVNSDVISADR